MGAPGQGAVGPAAPEVTPWGVLVRHHVAGQGLQAEAAGHPVQVELRGVLEVGLGVLDHVLEVLARHVPPGVIVVLAVLERVQATVAPQTGSEDQMMMTDVGHRAESYSLVHLQQVCVRFPVDSSSDVAAMHPD